MSIEALRESCTANAIRSVFIVDDVLDVPDPAGIEAASYASLVRSCTEELRRAVSRASSIAAEPLPRAPADLEDHHLEPYWTALWRAELLSTRLAARHRAALRAAFETHRDDVVGALDLIAPIASLFRGRLGLKVFASGVGFDPEEAARADIVVVDFFLGQRLTKEQALESALEVCRRIGGAAEGRRPSFLLTSSQPQDVDEALFRRMAEVMRCRFRFFAKRDLGGAQLMTLLDLQGLLEAYSRAAKIEALVDDWCEGLSRARDSIRSKMLEFDVSDFVYLDRFRLYEEGTTLGSYLRWFLGEALRAYMPRHLNAGLWTRAESLRLFDPGGDGGVLETFSGPSGGVASVYGDILFDESRASGASAFPDRIAAGDLVEGDLFARRRRARSLEGAEVLMVLTPSCDLMVRAGKSEPRVRNVLLLAGALRSFKEELKTTALADVEVVQVPIGEERKGLELFRIDWRLKEPVSIPWSDFRSGGPIVKRYRRLGRVRDLYFHRVRDRFVADVSHIANEVPPLMPAPRAGEVQLKVKRGGGKERHERLFSFEADQGMLWSFGEEPLFQSSRSFVEALLKGLSADEGDDEGLAKAKAEALAMMDDLALSNAMLRPAKAGARGGHRGVDLRARKSVQNSQAKLLIIAEQADVPAEAAIRREGSPSSGASAPDDVMKASPGRA